MERAGEEGAGDGVGREECRRAGRGALVQEVADVAVGAEARRQPRIARLRLVPGSLGFFGPRMDEFRGRKVRKTSGRTL